MSGSLFVHLLVALAAALVGGAVALWLRQSIIVGFLIAGLALSPFTPGFVGPSETIDAVAEIGIVFLMFAVGVQLSLRELLRVGRISIAGGLVQVALTMALGAAVGLALGFGAAESLVFGAVVSNSSSTVLGKVLGERGELDTGYARTSLAWSSVQDISTVVLVAAFSALSPAQSGQSQLRLLAEAAVFLFGVVPASLWLLPWVFARASVMRSREIFILLVATVALGMAWTASFLGISIALGAFLAGVGSRRVADRPPHPRGRDPAARHLLGRLLRVDRHVDRSVLPGRARHPRGGHRAAHGARQGRAQRRRRAGARLHAAHRDPAGGGPRAVGRVLLPARARRARARADRCDAVRRAALERRALHPARAERRRLASAAPLPADAPRAAQRAQPSRPSTPDGHAIVCGYGRVGSVVSGLLGRFGAALVVIDEDPQIVQELRKRGVRALLGDAAQAPVLDGAGVARARLLVVCVPERMAVRRIVEHAQAVNPGLVILARAHSHRERNELYARGVAEVVLGEQELALELGRRSAQVLGLESAALERELEALRRSESAPG